MVNRIKSTLPYDIPTLQADAAAQASEPPRIPPKFQQMSVRNQALPISAGQPFSIANSPFASYASGTSSPFPTHQPGQPSAWKADTAADMAAWVNGRLGDAPAAPHGIMPHPYAVRETVTEDLQQTSGLSLPMRNPTTFVDEFLEELEEEYETQVETDSQEDLDQSEDIDQSWQQHELEAPPAASLILPPVPEQGLLDDQMSTSLWDNDIFMEDVSGFGNRATAVSDFDHSSSNTEISEIEDQLKRDGSETTLIGSSDAEDEQSSSGSSDPVFSKTSEGRAKKQSLKRKSSWTPVHTKKQKLDISEDKERERERDSKSSFQKKKAKSTKKVKARPWAWRKIIASFGRPSA
jgi:hypothetical protein